MKKITFIAIFLISSNCFAYELDGDFTDNLDGTYEVTLQNEYGHVYDGEAQDNGDGTFEVDVTDYNGEEYEGDATKLDSGEVELDLSNTSSGGEAYGTADITN